jgi:hypothetical protein
MKAVLLALCLATSVYGVAIANESPHAAVVDMPEVATLAHACPDTWHTLPPVQPMDVPTSTVASENPLISGQVGRLQPRCDSIDVPRNSLSLVRFF